MINIKNLVGRYAIDITHEKSVGGGWDSSTGNYVEPTITTETLQGALFTLSNDDLLQIDGGEITADDRKLYVTGKLVNGERIIALDKTYLVVAELKNYESIIDFFVYHIKREGASV